ncbi:MAG: D-aminoacylase [Candidatus Koribacter versatilis]|uniref:D-aminoacylase n=1 Tax=Candidatus Korobacter versatilis TaxID=658062 RepID=A0A932EP42_9BACT|nr:D-aminoacylase [Candidatus Koribacter versatilis]
MRRVSFLFALLLLAVDVSAQMSPTQTSPTTPGTLLRNVLIFDGAGSAPVRGDVRIAGDRIAAVGAGLAPLAGETVIDEHGLALAPGFIDMHSHAGDGIFKQRTAGVMVRQGITTALIGQDGGSEFPLADFLAHLDREPAAMNFASMSGQGTLREQVMGKGQDLLRPSTAAELGRMRALLTADMKAGAFGLSTGLEYDPAHFSTTDEVVELSKVAAAYGGFYISHVRDEGNEVFKSFDEVLEIGRRGGLPVEITHIKLGTTPVWHLAAKRMPLLFAAAGRGHIRLTADVYPYTFWHSDIRVIMLDRDYFNPKKVAKVIAENGGADRIHVVHYGPQPAMNGKDLAQIAKAWHMTPVEAYMRIVKATMPQADGKEPEEDVIVESMSEDDLRWFIADPNIMYCTDGGLTMQHPRSAGSFPRILGRYARDLKLLSMQEAIRKMTSMPAQHLGLADRGKVAPGYVADLVLFDPATILDQSTLEKWDAPPLGIPAVMVSGQWVVRDGKITGALPGKVLRHAAKQ